MRRWFRRSIEDSHGTPTPEVSRTDNSQREATEKRIQLAVAEANARAEALLRQHAEATEAQIADAASRADRMVRELGEAHERRIQLMRNQVTAYAEERCSGLARDVRDLRQHLPAFLNAVATVPALGFELSSFREALETARADLDAISRHVGETREQVEARLATSDGRNDDLVAFLKRFENVLIDKESDLGTLRASSAQATAELARLREVLADAQTDRGHLWRSAEGATRGIGDLWQRLEFVRKEIMYEMQSQLRSGPGHSDGTRRPSRVLAEEKVEVARSSGDIRINLGCGHIPVPGYVNVDFRELPGVDIVADAADLPFDPGSVSEITSFHVLEHFTQEQLRRLLPYWRSLLKREGTFRAVVPDGEAMLAHQAAGTYSFEDFRMVLFGAQEYEGDFHFNMLTPDYLGKALTEAGFRGINYPAKGRKNDICFEFEVTAINP